MINLAAATIHLNMPKFYLSSPVLLFFLLLSAAGARGQEAPDLLSPQTRDFFHTVSHYTGTVNMSIPLYTYKDKDFEIPLALSYNASGFIPSKREGPVGLNWALNAGGAVVRKVNGLPDDCSGKNEKGERKSPMGIWAGAKNRKLGNFNKQDIFNLRVGEQKDGYWTANDVELTPDEFTFVAPGLSGWFYINYDGTVKCAGNKPFVVELNSMVEQPAKGTQIKYSTITITADNGYKYLFGGGDAEKEWSIYFERKNLGWFTDVDYIADSSAVVTAWHLKTITAPNGRKVEYNYKRFDAGMDYLYNAFFDQSDKVDARHNLSADHVKKLKIKNVENITKTAYLESIAIGTAYINFGYSPNERPFHAKTIDEVNKNGRLFGINHTAYNQSNLKLDKVEVRYGNEKITDFQFAYSYLGNPPPWFMAIFGSKTTGQRLFLTSVTEQQQLANTFSYYIPEKPLPNPLTKGIDHWGFWNGKDGNTSLVPAAGSIEGDISYTETIRDPDGAYCNAGLLKSITYPTGGKTTFFYEPHKYTQRLERRYGNNYLPALYNMEGITGGARIAAVDYSNGQNTQRVTYTYPAGGILMSWPRYAFFYEETRGDDIIGLFPVKHMVIRGQASSVATNYYPGESFIHYPEVWETRSPDNGYIKYFYTNYADTPDNNDFFTKQHVDNTEGFNYLDQWRQLRKQYSSRYFERGLLTSMQVYDKEGRPVERKHIDYSTAADFPGEWVPSVAMGEFDANAFKIYHCPIAPQRETVTQYFDNHSITTVTGYDYHNRKDAYPVIQTTTASDGTVLKTEYRYIDDHRDNAEYAAMREKNIRNIPIETIHYKGGAVIGASLVKFQFFNDAGANRKVYPSEVLQLETNMPVTDFDGVNIDRRMKPQQTYERYDSYGNVLQQRSVDGLTASYLWDYSGLYKLAEVVGATYDEVREAAAGMNLSVAAPDAAYLRSLRDLREKLPQAMITNYTYKPLVGISSQTGPNGLTTYYEYDALNRLKRVRDHEGKVVREHEYRYHDGR